MSVLKYAAIGLALTACAVFVVAAFSIDPTKTLIFFMTILASACTMTALQASQAAKLLRVSAFSAIFLIGATAHLATYKTPRTDIAAVANVQTSDVVRAYDGQFRAKADVNGGRIAMLVDTGASIVLLTHKDAISAGIDPEELRYKLPILTANGKTHVAAVTLDQVRIGDVAVQNVRAAVAKPGQLHASLLGMSFIGEIEEAVIRKDRLILRN